MTREDAERIAAVLMRGGQYEDATLTHIKIAAALIKAHDDGIELVAQYLEDIEGCDFHVRAMKIGSKT